MLSNFMATLGGLCWVQWINLLIAIAGVLIVLGACNRMTWQTDGCIRAAFGLVAAGLFGYGLSHFTPDSYRYACDTVLLGGIVALVIGTRKQTIWIPPAWMPRLSYATSALTVVTFFLGVA